MSFILKNGLSAARPGKSLGSDIAAGIPGPTARRSIAAGLLGAAVLTSLCAGCQDSTLAERFPHTAKIVKFMKHNPPVKPEPEDPPIVVDAAMLERQWPQSQAKWANATMVGWPMRFPFNSDITSDRPFPNSRVMDSFLFLYQYFRLPFTYIAEPPFKTVIWTSDVKYNPTFEAVPELPPSPDLSKAETPGEEAMPTTAPGSDVTGGPLAPGDTTNPAAVPGLPTQPATDPAGKP
jgi:hypothetical protein